MTARPQPGSHRGRLTPLASASLVLLSLSLPVFAQAPSPTPPPVPPSAAPGKKPASPAHPSRDSQLAQEAYLSGARLLQRNDLGAAAKDFSRAAALDPSVRDYTVALTVTREHQLTDLIHQAGRARLLGQTARADSLLAQARTLDPQNPIVTQHDLTLPRNATFSADPALGSTNPPWLSSPPALAGPIQLTPSFARHSIHLHADAQTVLRQVFTTFGIRPTFDASVPTQDIRFDLEDTTYAEAVPILLRMTHVFAVPLEPTSVILARDTQENRQRLERQVQETVYIPGSTTEQMAELGNVVRNVFDIRQVVVQASAGNLILRAPAETIRSVNLILADLLDGSSEVVLDLRLYAVDKTRNRNIGTQLPQQFGIYNVASAAQNLVSSNQTIVNQAIAQGVIPANASNIVIALYLISSGLVQSSLLTNTLGFFGNGLTLTGVNAIGTTSFNLALNSSDSRALDDIQLRIGDRQTATFRAGTRYPITTSTYTAGTTASSASLAGITINGVNASSLLNQYLGSSASVTIPQIQYEDLGVTLKSTPTVQKSGEIAMHLDLKIEALAGGAVNNIPILASRQFVSDISVRDGDTVLMISSLNRSESRAVSGVPGIGELPGFQSIAADRVTETDSSELILLITPHVVRRRSSAAFGPRIAVVRPAGAPR